MPKTHQTPQKKVLPLTLDVSAPIDYSIQAEKELDERVSKVLRLMDIRSVRELELRSKLAILAFFQTKTQISLDDLTLL